MKALTRGIVAVAIFTSTAFAQRGRIVVDTVRSAALANRYGSPEQARVSVYLPPSYDRSTQTRYPVVYLLHGFGASDANWTTPKAQLGGVPGIMDALIAAGTVKEMIVVMPNASTRLGGSFYVNSAASGRWDDFVAHDLVAWTDKTYRTLAKAESRGIAGHSMGGFGAMYLGMVHGGETYGAMYAMSPCCTVLAPFDPARSGALWDSLAAINSLDDWRKHQFVVQVSAALMAAVAPDTTRSPVYASMLEMHRDGRWEENAPAAREFAAHLPVLMIPRYKANLASMRGVALDIGAQDDLVDPREVMRDDSALTKAGIKHQFQIFQGNHVDHIGARLNEAVFPFFSRTLVFETRP